VNAPKDEAWHFFNGTEPPHYRVNMIVGGRCRTFSRQHLASSAIETCRMWAQNQPADSRVEAVRDDGTCLLAFVVSQ
jgi:hypothetical protein